MNRLVELREAEQACSIALDRCAHRASEGAMVAGRDGPANCPRAGRRHQSQCRDSGRFIGSGSLNSPPERGCIARISKGQVSAASPKSYGPRSAEPLRANNGRPRPG
jgi:hypothetical protein